MRIGWMAGAMLLIGMPGVAAQQTAKPTAEAYYACLKQHSGSLDDKTSDARTIAAAVMHFCHDEHISLVQARAGSDRNQAQRILEFNREHDLDQVSLIVLQERAKVRH